MDRELGYNDKVTAISWALNSAVECHLHTVEVTGSNPVAPTIVFKGLRGISARKADPQTDPQSSLNHLRSQSQFFQECALRGPCFIPISLGVEVERRLNA